MGEDHEIQWGNLYIDGVLIGGISEMEFPKIEQSTYIQHADGKLGQIVQNKRYGRISRKRFIKILMGRGLSKRQAEYKAWKVQYVGCSYSMALNYPIGFTSAYFLKHACEIVWKDIQLTISKIGCRVEVANEQ